MKKGREILGLPVVALSTGTRVGVVGDLAIDLDRKVVAAVLLADKSGESASRLIPFASIHRVGPHAVMIEDEARVVPASERPQLQALVESPVKVVGLDVLTEGGRLLGKVSDVVVDDQSGDIQEYEISAGPLRDVVAGRSYVSASAQMASSNELMIVPESAASSRRDRPEEGPPLVVAVPPWAGAEVPRQEIERMAADLLIRQQELVLGSRSSRTIANEDAGGIIVFEGQAITEDAIQRAKQAGKLNELIHAAGEGATAALSAGLAEQYAGMAEGRMAGKTVHAPDGEVIVSQGDVVTGEMVQRAREAGALDQLMEAIRSSRETSVRPASLAGQAAALWEQIGERVGWLIGRR